MASLGAGNVDITILDNTYTLKPTLLAAKTISKELGGGLGAINAISRFESEAITKIISVGLGLTANGEKKFAEEKGLEAAVYETGYMELAAPCLQFVNSILNGGKPLNTETEGDGPLEKISE